MFYLKSFVKSLYNLNWLRDQKNDIKKAGNYFLLFILFLTFCYASFFTFVIVPQIKIEVEDFFQNISNASVEIKDHQITVSGLEQPFETRIETEEGLESESLFIFIDTGATSTEYTKYSKVNPEEDRLVITSSTIALYGHDGIVNIQSAENMSDFFLNKDSALSLLENEKTIFIFALLIIFFVLSIQKFIILLLVSLFIYLIFKKRSQLNYKNILEVGLFALTGPSLLIAILNGFGVSFPFLYIFLLFLTMYLTFDQKKTIKKSEDGLEIKKEEK